MNQEFRTNKNGEPYPITPKKLRSGAKPAFLNTRLSPSLKHDLTKAKTSEEDAIKMYSKIAIDATTEGQHGIATHMDEIRNDERDHLKIEETLLVPSPRRPTHPNMLNYDVLKATENRKWEEIRRAEEEGYKNHLSSDKIFQQRLAIVKKYEAALKKPDLRPIVYRTSIGHYGGMYVDVPEEKFDEFKSFFPANVFPREVRQINDVREDFTFEGEEHFRKKFPRSNYLKSVFFADRSKGLKYLDFLELPHGDLND